MVSSKSIYFHEDDYCQIQLLPLQSVFSETGNALYPLEKLSIKHRLFEELLKEDALFYFETVYTGYSSFEESKKDTYAFGYENYVIYFTATDGIIIESWIGYHLLSETLNVKPDRLENSLYKIGVLYNLMLVDWREIVEINLSKESNLSNYIKTVFD